MKNIKRLPVLSALLVLFGLSYYLFTVYKPRYSPLVKGDSSIKEKQNYLESLPLPTGSNEVGRTISEVSSQLTVSSTKSPVEVQKFYRNVLTFKGWKTKNAFDESPTVIYTRDRESVEVSVLSSSAGGAVFSLSYSD